MLLAGTSYAVPSVVVERSRDREMKQRTHEIPTQPTTRFQREQDKNSSRSRSEFMLFEYAMCPTCSMWYSREYDANVRRK